MTATAEKWAERIAGWRESGLTSEKFCEGRDFSANGLRHWAYKLGKTKRRRRQPEVPIARVVRVPAPSVACVPAPAAAKTTAGAPFDSSLVIEIGGARVVVRPGFDRETLSSLVEVLTARGGAR
jgi:hypothetical protein